MMRGLIAVVVVGFALMAPSAAAVTSERRGDRLTTFRLGDFRTGFPARWSIQQPSIQPTMGALLVYLSNQPMHDPCTTTNNGAGVITQTCGSPIASLHPNSVLASWSTGGDPTI